MQTTSSSKALPALRSDLKYTVHRQQDDLWYAVQDPLTGKFLRLGRKEYTLATLMDGRRDIQEILTAFGNVCPGLAATEQDVQQLGVWLLKTELIHIDGQTSQAKPTHNKLVLNPLYTRVPLISGQRLERIALCISPLMTRTLVAAVILLCVVAAGSVLLNFDEFTTAASKLFVADGRLWWLAAWLLLKTAHELGHAVVAVKVGSQIRAAGISLIFMAPVPYVDISDLWTISNRWHRILCSAGGMLVELAISAIAAIVALQTEHASLQYFCCAVATMGTVTTLAFNANPLIRFDGYFIASDLLNRPNLWTDGQQSVRQLVNRIFRPSKAAGGPLRLGLVLYGLACYQYRIAMLLTLAAWCILVWQGLGLAMVAWGAYAMVLSPWMKARASAKQQPGPRDAGPRKWLVKEAVWGWSLASLLIVGLFLSRSPVQPAAPGVVVLHEPVTLRTEVGGVLEEVLVAGKTVTQGQLLAVFHNSELQLDVALKLNEVATMEERIRSKRSRGELAQLQSDESQLASLQTQLAQLQSKSEKLEVRAPVSGTLVNNNLSRQIGKFFPPGEPLCLIAEPEVLEVNVSASQNDVERMRACVGHSIQISLSDGAKIQGEIEKVEPRASHTLLEPLLAAIYDGPLTVEVDQDETGAEILRLPVPRFEVRIRVPAGSAGLTPGQMAWVRVPGRTATLWDALGRWFEKKWAAIEQQSEQG